MEEHCGGTLEKCWWNTHSGTSKKAMVEQWNSDGGTVIVEQCGWNSFSGTMMLAQSRWNSDAGTV